MNLIFEKSVPGRRALSLCFFEDADEFAREAKVESVPAAYARKKNAALPEVSELQAVRHYTQLSQKNFSIDSHFYPLGSCTMKYNPRAAHCLAQLPGFLHRHPLAGLEHSQGVMACLFELQELLKVLTGMKGVCLTPMAGAQGELAGVLMIRAYHTSRGDTDRLEMLVPDSAHGTNPASAVMAGFRIKEIPTNAEGDLDLAALKAAVGPQTAGIMLTNPSTLGLFERKITEVSAIVHQAGGLLYYDGANLNALLGRVRPGDMGFDVMHMNLHKTFATPHGGGGPGAGPIAVGERLLPFLPIPCVGKSSGSSAAESRYYWLTEQDIPATIGRMSAFMGNVGILVRAYIYLRLLGRQGVRQVSDMATLNANYLMEACRDLGLALAYPKRLASHEFIITFKKILKEHGISAMEVAKRILDDRIHAPTTYFPLLVPECWLIEPTETESKETLDRFVAVMKTILQEVVSSPERIKAAPQTLPSKRLDDVRAAKQLDVAFKLGLAEEAHV